MRAHGRVQPRAERRAPPGRSLFHSWLAGLYLLSFAGLLGVLLLGASFYLTPLAERAHHPGYWHWKSGGTVGRALGVTGSLMMVAMLLYSVRKRVRALRRLGALSRWLDIHIYLGTIGPLCVVLHSSFKVQGLVALSFWSMIAVVLSGLLGRFLYLQIPRTRAGEEMTLAEVEALDRALAQRLRGEFRLEEHSLRRLDALSAPTTERPGLLRCLLLVLFGDPQQEHRLREFARASRSVPRLVFREFERVVRQKALLRRRILLWDRLHELFHYWHVIHKPFALVMYLFMTVHIAVAVLTGYGWRGWS